MSERQRERHLLVIHDDRGCRTVALEVAAYSLGRDLTNAIVLHSETISRQHAMLLRLPIPQTNCYYYRLVDGNAEGKPSANGVFINQQRCSSHDLTDGDQITFGKHVTATYRVVKSDKAEFAKYVEPIDFQRLQSAVVNSKATCVSPEFIPEVLAAPPQESAPVASPPPLLDAAAAESAPVGRRWRFRWGWIAAVGLLGAIALVGAILLLRKPDPQPPQQSQPRTASHPRSTGS